MWLDTLNLRDFRNYTAQSFTFDHGVNLIYGENAQGKTNLLESIAALSTMKLFRTSQKKDGIRFGAENGSIHADFRAQNRDFTLEILFSHQKALEILRNNIKMRRQADAIGILKSVLFCPEDLNLVRDGAVARRRFLDTAICQLRPQYSAALGEYNKLLDHKTRILRDSDIKPALLELLDDFTLRLASFGAQLIHRRALFLRVLAEQATQIHTEIAGGSENLQLTYRTVKAIVDPLAPTSTLAEKLLEDMLQHRAAEISARSCLIGPHRDDIVLQINGNSAAAFASQGQVRTCALALKLAERELFFMDCGEYPLLLLDDVLSELDKKRQDFVLNKISGGQVFITCCEDELASKIKTGKIIEIFQGKQR